MRTVVKVKKEYEKEEITNVFCDWCGATMGTHSLYDGEYILLAVTGSASYPDGGWEKGWKVEDLCDSCTKKLRQLLVDNGLTVTEVDEGW